MGNGEHKGAIFEKFHNYIGSANCIQQLIFIL